MAGDKVVKATFLADVSNFLSGLSKGQAGMTKFTALVNRHSADMKRTAGVATAALAGLINQGLKYGENVDNWSKRTGIAAETLSGLSYAAENLDVDFKQMTTGLRKLVTSMGNSLDPISTEAEAFEGLGVKTTNADGSLRDLEGVLFDLADVMKSSGDSMEVLSTMTELLGGRSSALMLAFKAGSGGLKELMGRAGELNLVLDGKTAEALNKVTDDMGDVKLAARGLGTQLAIVAGPIISDLSKGLTGLLARLGAMPTATKRAAVGWTVFGSAALMTLAIGAKFGTIGVGISLVAIAMEAALTQHELIKESVREQLALTLTGTEAQKENAATLLAGSVAWQSWGRYATESLGLAITGIMTLNPLLIGAAFAVKKPGEQARDIYREFGAALQDAKKAMDDVASGSLIDEEALAELEERIRGIMSGATGGEAPKTLAEMFDLTGGTEIPGFDTSTFLDSIDDMGERVRDSGATVKAVMTTEVVDGITTAQMALESLGDRNTTILMGVVETGNFIAENAAGMAANLVGTMEAAFTKMGEIRGKFAKTLLKASAEFLRQTLKDIISAEAKKALAEKISMVGKALMEGTFNWAALAKIPLILAAYGATTAALSAIKFHGGGGVGGYGAGDRFAALQVGEIVLSRDTVKAIATGGGRSVNIDVNIAGGGDFTKQDLAWEMNHLAQMIRAGWSRG